MEDKGTKAGYRLGRMMPKHEHCLGLLSPIMWLIEMLMFMALKLQSVEKRSRSRWSQYCSMFPKTAINYIDKLNKYGSDVTGGDQKHGH